MKILILGSSGQGLYAIRYINSNRHEIVSSKELYSEDYEIIKDKSSVSI